MESQPLFKKRMNLHAKDQYNIFLIQRITSLSALQSESNYSFLQ